MKDTGSLPGMPFSVTFVPEKYVGMIYPQDFEEKIGFHRIRQNLNDLCFSELGREEVEKMEFSDQPDLIRSRLDQTEEFRQILISGDSFPSQDFYNMIPLLHYLHIEGTCPEQEQLAELRLMLESFIRIVSFFTATGTSQFPELSILLRESFSGMEAGSPDAVVALAGKIVSVIHAVLDEKGQIRSTASPELQKIRKKIRSLQQEAEHKIGVLFKQAKIQGWVPENAELTVRNGRPVIPVMSSYKRHMPGFIHDESATGQTVYLEPTGLFEMNNEVRELEYAERREIVRILIHLADQIRPEIQPLIACNRFMGKIDFIRAKASFALDTGAMRCREIHAHPMIKWEQAIHPLLFLTHRKAHKPVVPLTIQLTDESRILVISGPNAGGKSICLKTVGLLQYMFQCGILPPARDDSEFGIFSRIMIDIGDEQSLENDLSTYTSKLLNMKYFLNHVQQDSLFLIDELGTGTDPSLGGALAQAVLEALAEKKAFGVVTTHYSNLKLLAGKIPGITNGAMLFDTKKMQPLFQLNIGKPGSSFALEIADSIGFPARILQRATDITGISQLNFDRQLQDLEVEKEQLGKRSEQVRVADDFLTEMIRNYETLTADLEKSKQEIIRNAKEKAAQLVKDSNKLIEKTIREIRESQANKERTREVRNELETWKQQLQPEKPAEPELPATSPEREHRGKSIDFPVHTLKKFGIDYNQKIQSFELTLDLRGTRADEAFLILQKYIDDALLLSIKEVRILHGKGNGVLRQITRDYLRSVKEVKKYHDEALERGGSGITVAILD